MKEKLVKLRIYYFKKLKNIRNTFNQSKLVKNLKNINLKHTFIFFVLPFILATMIITWFHGHFSKIAIDAMFVALSIFIPLIFSFMLSIFSIDKELLRNEKDHQLIKEFNDDISLVIFISLISLFLILIKILFEDLVGNIDISLDFVIFATLLIIGLNLLEILNKLFFLAKERLREITPKKK